MSTQSARESLSATIETRPEPPSEAIDLPLDEVFDVLSNERRRRVLRYLRSESETTLGDLAEHIASIENDKPEDAITSAERKRVYICLYQSHLPKMDDLDVIDFDADRKTVRVSDSFDQATRFLPRGSGSASRPGNWTDGLADLALAIQARLPIA